MLPSLGTKPPVNPANCPICVVWLGMSGLSLSDCRTGETPPRSGINWGQRPGRDANQAHLSVPQDVVRSAFFPPRAVQFTMHPDFGPSMLCVVAQDGDKAIHTTESNAIIGKYIRARLGPFNG